MVARPTADPTAFRMPIADCTGADWRTDSTEPRALRCTVAPPESLAVSSGTALASGLPVAPIIGLPVRDTTPPPNVAVLGQLAVGRPAVGATPTIAEAAVAAAEEAAEEEAAEEDVTTVPEELQKSYYQVPDYAAGWSAGLQQQLQEEKTKERKSLLSLWRCATVVALRELPTDMPTVWPAAADAECWSGRSKKHLLLAKLRTEQEAEVAAQETELREELKAAAAGKVHVWWWWWWRWWRW